ncbi:cupin domain-containing protein [Methylobacterium sp. ARG-1]|uniref:cupin domain-containing protein n=1 Tax=Methylobacterium sp. ARG-1 TaxID=1692501 RepID=UPI000681FB4D|nr:cupin domain-containing protein [Methylobacterium sp. ARG-1]KNY24009.1 cupin [Methylobacterium sp. ARG-1]
MSDEPETRRPGLMVLRESAPFRGKQGHIYRPAISAEAVGAKALHLQLLEIPPGERAHAHKHESHETAIHVLSGISGCFWGERLEHHVIAGAGEFVYIAADVPHLPYNRSQTERVTAVIARTDPNEQESVVLLPELEAGVDWSKAEG